MGGIRGSARCGGKLAVTPLSEQELDRVVGGYIGETEKNIRPATGKRASAC
jgi:hypothetical protein